MIETHSRILWIVPERLGDALMTTPAVRYIKEQCPNVFITAVTYSRAAEAVYQYNPWVDERVSMPSLQQRRELGKQHDLLIHSHPDFDEQLVNGYDLPAHYPQNAIDCHHAFFELKFAASLLGLSDPEPVGYVFQASPEEQKRFAIWREEITRGPDIRLVGIAPGCNRLAARGLRFWKPLTHKKAWPADKVSELISRSQADNKSWKFVLLGAGGEKKLAAQICRKAPFAVDMTGKTSGTEICALINQLDAVITMDSGLQHVTCACQRPLITLCGPTDPGRTGPWPHIDLFTVIHRNPVSDISVPAVYDCLNEIITNSASVRSVSAEITEAGN